MAENSHFVFLVFHKPSSPRSSSSAVGGLADHLICSKFAFLASCVRRADSVSIMDAATRFSAAGFGVRELLRSIEGERFLQQLGNDFVYEFAAVVGAEVEDDKGELLEDVFLKRHQPGLADVRRDQHQSRFPETGLRPWRGRATV